MNSRVKAIILCGTVAAIAACGGGGGAADTTAPTVLATFPAEGAAQVARNVGVTVTFSESMDCATVSDAFSLRGAGGAIVAGDLACSGASATFTPAAALAADTTFTAAVSTAAQDSAGNGLAAAYGWDFTTGSVEDTTAPGVQSTNPAADAVGVALNVAVSVTFSEPMDCVSVSGAMTLSASGGGSIAADVACSGSTAVLSPAANLEPNTLHTVTISTAATDGAGNPLASALTWNFTTGGAPDTTAPTIASTTPADGASGVAINSTVVINFSEAMDCASLDGLFSLKDPLNNAVALDVHCAGTSVTYTPASNLAYVTLYSANLSAGARDLAGNAAGGLAWSFTTGAAPDTTPPSVSSVTPTDGSTVAPDLAAIEIAFSEAMDCASVNGAITLTGVAGVTLGGATSCDGANASFAPPFLGYERSYTATVTTAAQDAAGNALAADHTWNFTTGWAMPRFAYALKANDELITEGGALSVYVMDNATGRLLPHGYVQIEAGPAEATAHPSGNYLYVTNETAATITAYAVDGASGRLSMVNEVAAGTGVRSLVIEPNARFAYAANSGAGTIGIYAINAATGALSAQGSTEGGEETLVIDRSGRFLYSAHNDTVDLFAIDAATGALTLVDSTVVTDGVAFRLQLAPDGSALYVLDILGQQVLTYAVAADTGILTLAGSVAAGSYPVSLAVEPLGRFAYVADAIDNDITIYTIDAGDGTLAYSVAFAVGASPAYHIGFGLDDAFLYAAFPLTHTVAVYAVDTTTGALSPATVAPQVTAHANPSYLAFGIGKAQLAPQAKFLYAVNSSANSISAYSVNAATGALTVMEQEATGSMPRHAAADPTGRHLYVPNLGANTVSAYAIDSNTGALASMGAVDTGQEPFAVAVEPSGRFAYVSNWLDDTIGVYAIDAATGALSATGSTAAGNGEPAGLAVEPSGRFLYAANVVGDSVTSYAIDADTGALTLIDTDAAGNAAMYVAVDPTGRFVYVGNVATPYALSVFSIDSASGQLTAVGSAVSMASIPLGLAFSRHGDYLYVGAGGNLLSYAVDPDTGALTAAGAPAAGGTNGSGLAVDPSGNYLYSTNDISDSISIYALDGSGGASAVGSPVAAGDAPLSVVAVGTLE